jgi:hypothetical protein
MEDCFLTGVYSHFTVWGNSVSRSYFELVNN